VPTRVYLLRHGEVEAKWRRRIYGSHDVALSERGRDEARVAARRVPRDEAHRPRAVISSGLARAVFGAERIAERCGIPHATEPDLREIDRGEWVGCEPESLPSAEAALLRAWFQRPGRTRAPGGESLHDLDARVAPVLDALAKAHADASVCVVAHLWVIRTAVCRALAIDLDLAPRIEVRTGGMVVLDWPAGAAERARLRPTLAGLGTDRPPLGGAWFRGPHRG